MPRPAVRGAGSRARRRLEPPSCRPLARHRAVNKHLHYAFTRRAWPARALNALPGAVSTGRTVQLVTSSDHARTPVILMASVSDRPEGPRAIKGSGQLVLNRTVVDTQASATVIGSEHDAAVISYFRRAARSLSFSASTSSFPFVSFPSGSIRMTVPKPGRPNRSHVLNVGSSRIGNGGLFPPQICLTIGATPVRHRTSISILLHSRCKSKGSQIDHAAPHVLHRISSAWAAPRQGRGDN